jgi:hypothetical protein
MSVIATAADAGYRMFIVLSGITDSLRTQTQAWLDQVLVGTEPDERRVGGGSPCRTRTSPTAPSMPRTC